MQWLTAALLIGTSFKTITFADKPPTAYTITDTHLQMAVDQSASALILPFTKVHRVKRVNFQWKSSGRTNAKDKTEEQSRRGDDFVARVGLIIAGDPPFVPFFAPAWVKAIRDHMLLPANRLLYVVPDTRTSPGERWTSAFSSSIEYIAARSVPQTDGWSLVGQDVGDVDVVGLWLMADGDDTKAAFTTQVRSLNLD